MANEAFVGGNYALMRHGNSDERTGEIIPKSQEHCRKSIRKLVKLVGNERFRIYSSPAIRAKNTAKIVLDELIELGITVETTETHGLLYCEEYMIERAVKALIRQDDGVFTLLISHKPDIEDYADPNESLGLNIGNCQIIGRNFRIV